MRAVARQRRPKGESTKGIRKMKYRVHRFNIRMTTDQNELERFLNSLEGEVIAIVPNVTLGFFWAHRVDFVLIVEKLA
jgi:predicted esterase YcpF (UPF0227 family)